jgi:hypothetical protein
MFQAPFGGYDSDSKKSAFKDLIGKGGIRLLSNFNLKFEKQGNTQG